MKIIFISEYYPPIIMGGGEINLAQIAQELAKQKHEIIVLTSSFPTLAKEEVVQGVTIIRKLKTGKKTSTLFGNFQRRFLFPRSIIREARRIIIVQNPDVVHFIGTSIIAAPKIKKYHQKLCATIESYPTLCPKGDRLYHGKTECTITCTTKQFVFCQKDSDEIGKMKNKWYLKYNPLFVALTYRYYRQLNKALSSCQLIAISGYVQRLLQQYKHESIVIPNAFDAAPFSIKSEDSTMKSERKKHKKPVVLYVGALIQSKGPQTLVESLPGLNCRCEFYGEGILKEQLQQKIQEYNLDAEIFLPVSYDKMPEVYAKADIVVFPSLWPEPFGRIPLEAMAAGKPIITSNIGAIPEIVGKNGILVGPGNSQELQKAILTTISKKEEKFKNGKPDSLSTYEPSSIIAQLCNLYEEKK